MPIVIRGDKSYNVDSDALYSGPIITGLIWQLLQGKENYGILKATQILDAYKPIRNTEPYYMFKGLIQSQQSREIGRLKGQFAELFTKHPKHQGLRTMATDNPICVQMINHPRDGNYGKQTNTSIAVEKWLAGKGPKCCVKSY